LKETVLSEGVLGSISFLRERMPFSPRYMKDVIEEDLFQLRRDLFTSLDMVFFTTLLRLEGNGGETPGRPGHSKDADGPISSRI